MKIATLLAASMLSLGSAYTPPDMHFANYEDANVFAGRQASVDAKIETHLANYEDANVFAGRMASADDLTRMQFVNYENDGHVASANGSKSASDAFAAACNGGYQVCGDATGGPSGSPGQYSSVGSGTDEIRTVAQVPEGNGHIDIA
jgi:hypothetical protein